MRRTTSWIGRYVNLPRIVPRVMAFAFPRWLSGKSYFSEEAVKHPSLAPTNLLVPPSRQKHGKALAQGSDEPTASVADRMRSKLAGVEGRALYKMRKAIVEPVFGQIKAVRGLRQFLMRGLEAARGELALIALTHNLLKLFRSGVRAPRPIAA